MLGFTSLSATLLLTLMGITALYVLAAELTKRVFYARQARHAADGHRLGPYRSGSPVTR